MKNDSDNFSASTNTTDSPFFVHRSPPEPLLVDRIQLALLIALFVVGAPLNLVSLTKLRGRRSLARTGRLALLRLHLNISDLMVLFIYVTSSACWKLTYQWRGGDFLCKAVKFLNSMSFQLSSNIIVCVALDRLFTIICGTVFYKRYVNRHPARYVRFCVLISWLTAVGVNIPQFFVWLVVAPFPHTDPTWAQCITVWSAKKTPPFQLDQFTFTVLQLASLFWIPAAVIVISYTIVVLHMYQLSAKRKNSARRITKAKFIGHDGATQLSHVDSVNMEMTALNGGAAESQAVNGRPKIDNDDDDQALHRSSATTQTTQTSASSKSYLLPVAIHRMRNRTFRTSLLLITAYFVCWTPYNVLALWQFFDAQGFQANAAGQKYLYVLIVFNSVVNPFLYGTLKFKLPRQLRRKSSNVE